MPTFNGKYVRRCPRGYIRDKKTDMCVLKKNFRIGGGGGGSGLIGGGGGLGPVNPFTPVTPVTPVDPDDPDKPETRDAGGGGLSTGEIVAITLGSATALATLSEVIRRYYVDTPNTALNRRLARDDAMEYIESRGITPQQLEESGYTLEQYGYGDQELVPTTLVKRGKGKRTNVNVDEVADTQGAIRDPQDMISDEERLERFFEEQRRMRTGEGGIELTDTVAIDIDAADTVAIDIDANTSAVLPDGPGVELPQKQTPSLDANTSIFNADKSAETDRLIGEETMLEDFEARTSILTPQRISQIVRDLDIRGGIQRFFGNGGSGRNRITEPKPPQSDLWPEDVIDDEEPLLGRQNVRQRRAERVDDAELQALLDPDDPVGGAPADTIDDADLDVDVPTDTIDVDGGAPTDTIDDAALDDPINQIIEEEAETNIKYTDSDFIPDNVVNTVELPSGITEDVLIETDAVGGLIEQAALESGIERELVAIPTTSITDMLVSGALNGLEATGGIVEGIGGAFVESLATQSADVMAGLSYASGLAAEGADFLAAALAGDITYDALILAMAGGMGGLIGGLADVAMVVALPAVVTFGALVTIDAITGRTNYSGLGLNLNRMSMHHTLGIKYTLNKAFESLGIPLELMGPKATGVGLQGTGFFKYDGEIYLMSDLKTILPEAFKNNPTMRRNINFAIERFYEASSFYYNNTELQEKEGSGEADYLGTLTFEELMALERPLRKKVISAFTTKIMSLQQEFNDFKKKYDEENYTSFEDHADFVKHKFRQERGGMGVKANILNGGTGVVATAFGGDVNKLNQVLNRMHYMEEATYGYEGVSVDRPYLKPAELVVQGYIDQLISTAKTPDTDTLTAREQAIVGNQNQEIEGLGTGEANAIGRTEDPNAIPIQESAYSKIEPTYGQDTQPFQFAPESEMNPTRPAPSTSIPAEA